VLVVQSPWSAALFDPLSETWHSTGPINPPTLTCAVRSGVCQSYGHVGSCGPGQPVPDLTSPYLTSTNIGGGKVLLHGGPWFACSSAVEGIGAPSCDMWSFSRVFTE
jgi:hypothetical protein